MNSVRRWIAAALALLLFVCSFSFFAVSAQIPADAVTFRGHSYSIYHQTISWTEAKAYCENLGGHLATITTQEEQLFIESLNKDQKQLWAGGYRDDNFVWHWVTGEPWSYTHWGSGEPNNNGGNETKLTVWPLEWNDLADNNLGEQSGFICEWESAVSDVVTWNGHRYQLIEQSMTWTEAKAYCEKLGGHLVTITSQKEQDVINGYLTATAGGKDFYWIGLFDDGSNSNWKWVTGEPVSYVNWTGNEPTDAFQTKTIINKNGGWLDNPDEGFSNPWSLDNTGILCEWEPAAATVPATTKPTTTKPVTAPVTTKPAATTKAPATTQTQATLQAIVTSPTSPDGSGAVQLDGQDYPLLRYEDFSYFLQQLDALIVQYLGTAQRVEIPERIDDHPVVGVSDNAFAQSQATEVVVPASVYRFGDHAFESQQGSMTIICEEGSPAAQYAQKNGNPVELRQVYTIAAPTNAAANVPAQGRNLKPLLIGIIAGVVLLGVLVALILLAKKRKGYE
ncbi:MAG: hypothetical protein IJK64_06415 [Clostridia bacterium]|nr:hypothetical protein [Clostridia bacterium]